MALTVATLRKHVAIPAASLIALMAAAPAWAQDERTRTA